MSDSDSGSYALEVRKVSETVGETGTADRTDDTYQLGAVIDGGFVPFVTKSASYVEHLAANDKARQEQDSSGDGTTDQG